MNRIIGFLFVFFLCLFAHGQNISKLVNEEPDYLSIGNKLYNENRYFEALPFLVKARQHRVNKDNTELAYRLAECYRVSRSYSEAANLYREVIIKDEGAYSFAYLWLGKMLQSQGKYDSATVFFDRFVFSKGENDSILIAKYGMEACQYALKNMDKLSNANIKELSISGIESPSYYGGYLMSDVLWLTASVKINKNQYLDLQDVSAIYEGYFVDRLYYGNIGSDLNVTDGKVVENMFYGLNSNYLPPTFNPDETQILVSVCSKSISSKCQIKLSEFNSNSSFALEAMEYPVNEDNSSSKDPQWFHYKDKDYIVFSSNRAGGSGGYDLYMGTIDSTGAVKDLKNMGDLVNGIFDEISPFYDADNEILYFASDGHPGYGGFDIYSSTGNPIDGFNKFQNKGIGINTASDEYYYYQKQTQGSRVAFLSSNRSSKNGCDKVYSIEWINKVASLKIHTFDRESKMPINNTLVEIKLASNSSIIVSGYTKENNEISATINTGEAYNITFHHDGYERFDTTINIGTQSYENTVNIFLVPLKNLIPEVPEPIKPIEVPVVKENVVEPDFVFPIIYYGFGQFTLAPSEKIKLDKLAQYLIAKKKDIYIAVASHTDNIDSKGYNIKLSEKRTNSVIQYLLAKGVTRDRLLEKWYGEDAPAVPNQNPDGSDDPDGRQLNRRTEFKIASGEEMADLGAMTTYDKNTPMQYSSNVAPLELDDATMKVMLVRYGNKSIAGLVFKIQIGAYTQLNLNAQQRELRHKAIKSKYQVEINEERFKNFTRFLAGEVKTLNEAYALQNKIRKTHVPTAFFIAYYKGERINLIDVFEVLGNSE